MKVLALTLLVGIFALLGACASTPSSPAAASSNGTALGDSGIHASGYLETGGSVHPR